MSLKKWQEDLTRNITTTQELADKKLISEEDKEKLQNIIDKYPMNITEYYLGLDQEKRLRRSHLQNVHTLSFSKTIRKGLWDTSGEAANTVDNGIQHKYDNTVLLLSTNICSMYCRHCFRKRVGWRGEEETLTFVDKAVDYIKEHPEADNVLITGGDAFLNSNKVIEKYLEKLIEIEHIKFIRFGTRVPVVFPQRITTDEDLLNILAKYKNKKTIYVVTQFNHYNEFTDEAKKSIELLRENGVPVLNQTVLLAGVNDNPQTLVKLFNRLVEAGISPYYLFQCRPLKGVKNILRCL